MIRTLLLFLSILSVDLGGAWFIMESLVGEGQDAKEEPTFAVVELFTSQGCSSCPPADRLLGEIAHRGARQNWEVFTLSFHVDYWNRLGWRDPFSAAAYSERQRNYARQLEERVYTPMMVFNGEHVAVGSQTNQVWSRLNTALKTPASSFILLSDLQWDDKTLKITFEAMETQPDDVIHLALVQKEATVSVLRGENAGRILQHTHVVRSFSSYSLRDQQRGLQQFTLPDESKKEDFAVVAYIQSFETGRISGATRISL